jgi:hypothetical protein
MAHHAQAESVRGPIEAVQQVTQLLHVLGVVEQIAGRTDSDAATPADEHDRLGGAYEMAPALIRRRFDALADETSIWAAVGVEALLAARDAPAPPRAAAAHLADQLQTALQRMRKLLAN